MKLLTQELHRQLPAVYANEHLGLDAPALVKFFAPDAECSWYASEFDGDDFFFGFIIGHVAAPGSFFLSELVGVHGLFGLPIERDRHFQPPTLRAIQAHYNKHGFAL